MKTLGCYDGTYDGIHKMTIPMDDRVCWFGDEVYDAGPCRNYSMFALGEYVDRFPNNMGLLRIQMPCTKEELKTLSKDPAKEMNTDDLFVYYQVTRGTAVRTRESPAGAPANLRVMLKPLPSSELTEKIRLITVENTRFFHYSIKTLNLIPSVVTAQKASEAGCKETIFHRGDRVTECAHSNCHILREGTLYMAPADNLTLPDIAGAHLINNCKKLGIPISETSYALEELMHADGVLVTSSAKLCLSASEVDKKPMGGKAPELLKRIQDTVQAELIEQTDPHLD